MLWLMMVMMMMIVWLKVPDDADRADDGSGYEHDRCWLWLWLKLKDAESVEEIIPFPSVAAVNAIGGVSLDWKCNELKLYRFISIYFKKFINFPLF